MTFAAQMRLGSLEILAGMLLFAVVASRVRYGRASLEPALADAPVTVHLEVREGGSARRVSLRLSGDAPAMLGRSGEAAVVLQDPEISRRHARLETKEGIVFLRDLGSANGSFLNGKRLPDEGIEVRAGDDIDVGSTRINVLGAEPA